MFIVDVISDTIEFTPTPRRGRGDDQPTPNVHAFLRSWCWARHIALRRPGARGRASSDAARGPYDGVRGLYDGARGPDDGVCDPYYGAHGRYDGARGPCGPNDGASGRYDGPRGT